MKEFDLKSEIQKAEDYLKLLKEVDENGGAWSLFRLGECYRKGEGVHQDYEKAFYCYKKAERGCADAQLALGQCYFYGTGVEKDYSLAVYYFKQNEEPEDFYYLGICYEEGLGVPQDYKTAFHYYSEANCSTRVGRLAKFKVAEYYKNGWGVAKSEQKALRIYLEDAVNIVRKGGTGEKGKQAILELTDYKKLVEEELKVLGEQVANQDINSREYEDRKNFLLDLLK